MTGLRTAADVANRRAVEGLLSVDPVLVDVAPAAAVLSGMTANTVLTAGPSLPWARYRGGQRAGVIGGALHERLARDRAEADALLHAGEIAVAGCQDHGCVGSLAGVTTASMPVLVVEDRASGRRGYCALFEGSSPVRLNYGTYDETVERNLTSLREELAPLLGAAVRATPGGVALAPIMAAALCQGDELHSRTTAASGLLVQALLPAMLDMERAGARALFEYLTAGDYHFLRPAMAAAQVMAAGMAGVEGASVVTAMAFSCREFGIRVAATGDRWFRGPLPAVEACEIVEGYGRDDVEIMGGESIVLEVCGLGALAQAAAPALGIAQGRPPHDLLAQNLLMYEITVAEHDTLRIPALGMRGVPVGIDVHRVAETGITPALDVGLAGAAGLQIGQGLFRAPLEPFVEASAALRELG